MKDRLLRFAVSRPGLVFIGVALLAALLGSQIPRIDIDTDPENMLPEQQAERVFHDAVERRFGLSDTIVVGLVNETNPQGIYNVESLRALHDVSADILALDGVVTPDVMTLSTADNITQAGPGTLRFEWMMKAAPSTREQALAIREAVERLPLLDNTLVSGDGKAAAIYVPIESKDLSYDLSMKIQALTDAWPDAGTFHITGLPVAEDTFGYQMFLQMGISAPLAGLMIFLLMWYFFRSALLVVAPMLVAMATVIATMGLLIGLGFTVHIMSSMIPIFLMPIAVVDSVHVMSEFVDRYAPGRERRDVIREVIGHLFTPMLFTSVTTGIGFASLLLTPIPPVQVFGAFVAIGVLLAFVLTILLIPAYVVRMSPKSLAKIQAALEREHVDTPLARGLRAMGRFAARRGALVAGISAVVLVVSVIGISRIQINDNPVRWFKADHRIRVADRVLNDHFAGTYDAFLVLEADNAGLVETFRRDAAPLIGRAEAVGADVSRLRDLLDADATGAAYFEPIVAAADDALFDADGDAVPMLEDLLGMAERALVDSKYFQSPDALALVEELQGVLMDSGWVGKTNALPDVVKVVNRELRGGDADDYRVPGSVNAVAQTLLQYQSSHRPQDLWHMVTPDFRSTAIWLQLTSGDNQDMTRVVDAVDAWLAANPLPDAVTARWAGKTFINVVWQDEMVAGMLKSLLGAFVAVFVIMTLLFRSWRLGVLAMVPLTLTIVGVYGAIGWMGKAYDMPIAVLSSLTLGLSVDFAIHFIQRSRALFRELGSFDAAIAQMFEEPARAIARNAIVIALGFTPLFFAPLVPYITVGAFMAAIMAVSGAATLLLLPALLSLAPDWWLKTSGSDTAASAGAAPQTH